MHVNILLDVESIEDMVKAKRVLGRERAFFPETVHKCFIQTSRHYYDENKSISQMNKILNWNQPSK